MGLAPVNLPPPPKSLKGGGCFAQSYKNIYKIFMIQIQSEKNIQCFPVMFEYFGPRRLGDQSTRDRICQYFLIHVGIPPLPLRLPPTSSEHPYPTPSLLFRPPIPVSPFATIGRRVVGGGGRRGRRGRVGRGGGASGGDRNLSSHRRRRRRGIGNPTEGLAEGRGASTCEVGEGRAGQLVRHIPPFFLRA